MGAWGAGLFMDDVACDVRDSYRDLLGQGMPSAEATQKFLVDFKEDSDDVDDGPIVWLALAVTQWNLGRLEESIKARAIDQIDSGAALRSWSERAESGDTTRRKQALTKIREQPCSPQPTAKKIRPPPKRFADPFEWPVGRVFLYRLQSGKCVLFLVVDCVESEGGGYSAWFAILDWIGTSVPSSEVVAGLPLYPRRDTPKVIAISRRNESEPAPERVQWLDVTRPTKADPLLAPFFRGGEHIHSGYSIGSWGEPRAQKLKCLFVDRWFDTMDLTEG